MVYKSPVVARSKSPSPYTLEQGCALAHSPGADLEIIIPLLPAILIARLRDELHLTPALLALLVQ